MKRILATLALCCATLFVGPAHAVDVTITLTAAQAQRAATAIGRDMGLVTAGGAPRDATMAEAKQWLILHLRSLVTSYERGVQAQTISVPTFDPQ